MLVPVIAVPVLSLVAAAMLAFASPVLVLASPDVFAFAARRVRRPRRVRRCVLVFAAFAFCMLASGVLVFVFCASTTRSAKTSAAVVKVTERRTTRNLALLFLLTDGYP